MEFFHNVSKKGVLKNIFFSLLNVGMFFACRNRLVFGGGLNRLDFDLFYFIYYLELRKCFSE